MARNEKRRESRAESATRHAVVLAGILRLRPNVSQANIKESRFGIDFFRGFDLVLNGLDNIEARRHVNRLCQAAEVPLVESGTEGYVGQVLARDVKPSFNPVPTLIPTVPRIYLTGCPTVTCHPSTMASFS